MFKAALNLKIKNLHTMTKRKIGKSLFIHPNNEMFPITINRLPGAFDLNIGYIPIGYIQSFSAIISDHLNN